MTVELPLSVWATAQTHIRQQRAGRYVRESANHPGRMLPAIARAAISAYTSRGDLVLDPMCGVGTTLVEAIHLGRHAVGVEYEPVWADIARANLEFAAAQGAVGLGEVITGDALRLSELVDREICGTVGLVLTSPPYGASVHGQATPVPGRGVIKSHDRYSKDRTNLAHQPLPRLLSAFASILAACRDLLRPGGVVAVTARPYRRSGELVDLPAAVLRCGVAAGLTPYERNVALLAGLREDRLVPRASFFALDQVRRARRRRAAAAGDRPRGRTCVPACVARMTQGRPTSGESDGSSARSSTSKTSRSRPLHVRFHVRYVGGEEGRVLAVAQGRALRAALAVLAEMEVGQAREE